MHIFIITGFHCFIDLIGSHSGLFHCIAFVRTVTGNHTAWDGACHDGRIQQYNIQCIPFEWELGRANGAPAQLQQWN